MQKLNKKRYTIGLDPGVNVGFAVFDRQVGQLKSVETTEFWPAIEDIRAMFPPDECDIIVEDANLNPPVFLRGNSRSKATDLKIAQNVGEVKALTKLLIQRLQLDGYNVLPVKPLKHIKAAGATNARGKMTAEYFKRITGYDKSTSEHGRDAAMLCYEVYECRQQVDEPSIKKKAA